MKDNKTTLLAVLLIAVVAFASCGEKTIKSHIVYKKPINGFRVWIDLEQKVWGAEMTDASIYLLNDSCCYVVQQPLKVGKHMGLVPLEAKVWDSYYDNSKGPYLDWSAIVAFDDYDFDGEKELVICNNPNMNSFVAKHNLDGEAFTFYKLSQTGYVRMQNKPFDDFAKGLYHVHYDFDTCQKTLTLIKGIGTFWPFEKPIEKDTVVYLFI